MGLPVLVGVSRKSFIGRIAGGTPPLERLPGSLAAAFGCVAAGAAVLRVHDVAATQQALAVWQAIERSATSEAALRYHGCQDRSRPRCGSLAMKSAG